MSPPSPIGTEFFVAPPLFAMFAGRPGPSRGLAASLACQVELARLRPELRACYGYELHMRIGINTGPAVVGNLGSRRRFNYTMLGDAVNLAARLEGLNKQFGIYTLISETTQAATAAGVAAREISRVTVVGRRGPVRIFEPLPARGGPGPATVRAFRRRPRPLLCGPLRRSGGNVCRHCPRRSSGGSLRGALPGVAIGTVSRRLGRHLADDRQVGGIFGATF